MLNMGHQMLFTTYWVRRSDQRRDADGMSLDCQLFVGRILQTCSSNITESCGSRAQLLEMQRRLGNTYRACLRHRLIQTLGKEAENTPCPPIYRDEPCSRRFWLLTEVFVQAFAKLQPNSPQPCLHRGLTQVQDFCCLIR
jgi:hypothetical protein